MFVKGDRVKSTDKFASQFPRAIACNGGKPMTGTVQRTRQDGFIVVHWDDRVSPVVLHEKFIQPEKQH